jgi:hypothetical protein
MRRMVELAVEAEVNMLRGVEWKTSWSAGVVPTYNTTINYLFGSCWYVECRACTIKKEMKLD